MKYILVLLMIALLPKVLLAMDTSVKVTALFTDKALIMINGETKLLRKGETLHGVRLLSATGRGAVVRMPDGSKKSLGLNQTISSAYRKSDRTKHTVYADRNGMFVLDGQINGQNTQFLLDTGATYVAMSESIADRLGVPYETGRRSLTQTASSVVPVWNVKLDSVKVGPIRIPSVDAVVLPDSPMRHVLLGMSFLQHLNLERSGTSMVLQQKYK